MTGEGDQITGIETAAAAIAALGPTSGTGRGDLVPIRTGRLVRARREGWGAYAGGAAPGLSFWTADWLYTTPVWPPTRGGSRSGPMSSRPRPGRRARAA
ncbi:hypothetical protein Acsp04_19650 [Actinomadura sp. NBRC 104425]|nr:hypothetical protein Acsp04_19650 [Actinomadura sp. NBRC 104425]